MFFNFRKFPTHQIPTVIWQRLKFPTYPIPPAVRQRCIFKCGVHVHEKPILRLGGSVYLTISFCMAPYLGIYLL